MDAAMLRSPAIRRLLAVAAASASLLLPALSAQPAAAAALPTQGIFETCPLDSALSACEQRLSVMHSGGLQVVVINVGNTSIDALSQYAATAHSLGMSVMWELSNPLWWQQPATGNQASSSFSQFASSCGCSTNADVLAYMVRWLAALPGTYGYYAADDSMLSPGDESGVAAYIARIKQQDTVHTVLVGAANTNQGLHYEQATSADVAQEVYPITTASLLPQSANQSTWDSVDQTASVMQQAADHAGKPSAAILQAFTWGDALSDGQAIGVCTSADTTASCNAKLRYPSGAEQLALRNAVLGNSHPQLILWFSFYGTYGFEAPDSYFAPISADEAAARWAGLSSAIQAPYPSAQPSASAATIRNAPRAHAKKHAVRHRRHNAKQARGRHHKKHKKHKKHHA